VNDTSILATMPIGRRDSGPASPAGRNPYPAPAAPSAGQPAAGPQPATADAPALPDAAGGPVLDLPPGRRYPLGITRDATRPYTPPVGSVPAPAEQQPAAAGAPPLPQPELPHRPNPLTQWWQAASGDRVARKARGGNAWWLMRWMREQPTSVADHLDYYLNQRDERPDGRRGWGLQTAIPLINGGHALAHIVFGLTVGLAATLAFYALAWMCQRPGRAFLLAIAAGLVHLNLTTWLSGS
jgi:hypothetical protein